MNEFSGMVLTGVGLVSPAGTKKQDFFRYLKESTLPNVGTGESTTPEPGQLLATLDITEPRLKISRYMDPVSKNAIVAMRGALTDAGIDEGMISSAPFNYGIVLGTTRGPCLTREGLYESLASRQGKLVSATLFSHCGYNIAGAMTAIAYGMKGPNLTVADRGDVSLSVLRRARQFLMSGRAHTIFAGFTECHGAARRADTAFGEFAYLLCLERKDRALERGAVILAEVSLQDDEADGAGARAGVLAGSPGTDTPNLERDESPALPLPGLKAFGERYRSLFMIGLLSDDGDLLRRFPVFIAGSGMAGAKIKLLFVEEQTAAA